LSSETVAEAEIAPHFFGYGTITQDFQSAKHAGITREMSITVIAGR
jgi:hypothetical protein